MPSVRVTAFAEHLDDLRRRTASCATRPECLARAGDTVVCAPGEEHWHGATADAFTAHLAIQEAAPVDGEDGTWNPVTWLEPVPDDVYTAAQHQSAHDE